MAHGRVKNDGTGSKGRRNGRRNGDRDSGEFVRLRRESLSPPMITARGRSPASQARIRCGLLPSFALVCGGEGWRSSPVNGGEAARRPPPVE